MKKKQKKKQKRMEIRIVGCLGVYLFTVLMVIGAMFSTFLIIYFIRGGSFSLMQSAMWMTKYKDAYKSYPEIREEFAKYVAQCDGNEPCVIEAVANQLINRTNYIGNAKGVTSSPMETLKIDGGDCEDLSVLVVSVLRQYNIDAYVDCSIEHKHCVAFAFPGGEDYHYVIDLTHKDSYVQVINDESDFWSYYD